MRDCVGLVGSYVYVLVDPRDGSVFYVGKGKGQRFAHHLAEYRSRRVLNALKYQRIAEIVLAGHLPKALCVRDGMTPTDAFALEALLIQQIGPDRLTNLQRGIQTDPMRAFMRATAALEDWFSWTRWEEVRRWTYAKQVQWLEMREQIMDDIAFCRSLLLPSDLKTIKG